VHASLAVAQPVRCMTFSDRQRDRLPGTGGNLGGDGHDHKPTGPGRLAEGTAGVSSNRPTRQSAPRPGSPGQKRSAQRVRPLPKGTSLYTPGASPARRAAERRSAKPLLYLYQLPTWVAPLVLVVFLVAGLAMHGPAAAAALCVVAAVLAWLAALSWPRLSVGGRFARIIAVAAVLAIAGYQASR
jgi:hypothetical protein